LVTYRRKQEKSYLKSRKYQKRLKEYAVLGYKAPDDCVIHFKDTTVAEELESEWKNRMIRTEEIHLFRMYVISKCFHLCKVRLVVLSQKVYIFCDKRVY